jgi:hypothetical protein
VLGKIVPADMEVGRDAVHLATITLTSEVALAPGNRINIRDGKAVKALSGATAIVDPFLNEIVLPGEKFLALIMPRTIASLRHVWSHPDIPDEAAVTVEKVVERIVVNPMDELIRMLDEFGRKLEWPQSGHSLYSTMSGGKWDNYITIYDSDAHGLIAIPDECWERYEQIHGERSKHDPRDGGEGVYFSCSC